MKNKTEITAVSAFVGAVLSIIGYQSGITLGRRFLNGQQQNWTLAPYFTPSTAIAYLWFAVFLLWGSGLVAGLALPIYRQRRSVLMFFGVIAGTALAFNTFDWMLAGPIYDASQVSSYSTAWDFYFTHIILALWIGGFLVGLAGAFFWQDGSVKARKSRN